MSVILEKNQIVITIPTPSPDEELVNFQKCLLDIMRSVDTSGNTDTQMYWMHWLLREMIPTRKTFADLEKAEDFDIVPLRSLFMKHASAYKKDLSEVAALLRIMQKAKYHEKESPAITDALQCVAELINAINEGLPN